MKKLFANNVGRKWWTSSSLALKPDKIILLAGALFLLPALSLSTDILTAEEAIHRAVNHSQSIKALRLDSVSAGHDYKGARALRWPSLSLSAVSFYNDEISELNIGPIRRELGSHENYQADLKLQVPLYTGGKITHQIGLKEEIASSLGNIIRSEEMAVAYRARQAYLGALLEKSLLDAAAASLARVKVIIADVSNLHTAGLADSIDILNAELALKKAEQASSKRETGYRKSLIALAQLMGEKEIPVEAMALSSVPQPPTELAPDEIDSSRIARPELGIYDSRIRAATENIKLSRAAYFPTLSGFVGYSAGKPNKDLFNSTWNDYLTAGLALSWELNLGGKVHQTVQSWRQAANSARFSRSNLLDNFTVQARTAREDLQQAFRDHKSSADELEIARRQYRLAQEKQRAGSLSVNRLLELEADLAAAEGMHLASIMNFYLAQSGYMYTLGSPKIFGGL